MDEADLEDQKFNHALDAIKQGKPLTQFKPQDVPGQKYIKKAQHLINYGKVLEHDDSLDSYKHHQY